MTEDQYPAAAQTSASGPATAAAINAGRPGERPRPSGYGTRTATWCSRRRTDVQASCELSEDWFLTDDVIDQDGDKIMPFSVVDSFTGTVTAEALVLLSGQLSHLYPDAAATSGWSYTLVKTPFDHVSDAAVVGGGFGGQLMVTGPPSLPLPAAWLTRTGPGTWSVGAASAVPFSIERLSAGVSQYGPYFYGWVHGQAGEDDQFSLIPLRRPQNRQRHHRHEDADPAVAGQDGARHREHGGALRPGPGAGRHRDRVRGGADQRRADQHLQPGRARQLLRPGRQSAARPLRPRCCGPTPPRAVPPGSPPSCGRTRTASSASRRRPGT